MLVSNQDSKVLVTSRYMLGSLFYPFFKLQHLATTHSGPISKKHCLILCLIALDDHFKNFGGLDVFSSVFVFLWITAHLNGGVGEYL